jgi:hypothetical protein
VNIDQKLGTTQTAIQLRLVLLFKPGIVVTDVPYHVKHR